MIKSLLTHFQNSTVKRNILGELFVVDTTVLRLILCDTRDEFESLFTKHLTLSWSDNNSRKSGAALCFFVLFCGTRIMASELLARVSVYRSFYEALWLATARYTKQTYPALWLADYFTAQIFLSRGLDSTLLIYFPNIMEIAKEELLKPASCSSLFLYFWSYCFGPWFWLKVYLVRLFVQRQKPS